MSEKAGQLSSLADEQGGGEEGKQEREKQNVRMKVSAVGFDSWDLKELNKQD